MRNLNGKPGQESAGEGEGIRNGAPAPWGLWEKGIVWYLKDKCVLEMRADVA